MMMQLGLHGFVTWLQTVVLLGVVCWLTDAYYRTVLVQAALASKNRSHWVRSDLKFNTVTMMSVLNASLINYIYIWILTSYLRWKLGTLKPSAVTGLRSNGRRRLGPPPPWPHCTLHPARCCSASGDDGAQHGATGRTGDAWQLRNVGNSLNK